MEEEQIWKEVVEELDDRLGGEICGDRMKDEIVSIQSELEKDTAKTQHQLELLERLTGNEDKESLNQDLHNNTQQAIKQIESTLDNVWKFVEGVGDDLERVEEAVKELKLIEVSEKYLLVVKKVEEESSNIQSCLLVDSTSQAIQYFESLLAFTTQLTHTHCKNLSSYCQESILYWYNFLFTTLKTRLDKHISSLKWPFIAATQHEGHQFKKVKGDDDNDVDLDEFAVVVNYLIRIQLPSSYKQQPLLSFHHHDHQPLSLPLQILLSPFDVRFLFHFHGNKKTNSIDKPEWYFTQLRVWVNDHQTFINTILQPAFPQNVNVLQEFISGLCCLASDKLKSDLSQINNNNKRNSTTVSDHNKHSSDHNNCLIAHHIDEALTFYADLSAHFPSNTFYTTTSITHNDQTTSTTNKNQTTPTTHLTVPTPTHTTTSSTHTNTYLNTLTSSSPFCLISILTDESFFPKWISLEKDYALKKMDIMFETADAWCCIPADDDDDKHPQGSEFLDYKIPQFAQQYLFLLITILDRYRNLPHISCQLSFVDLHLELLEDFRIRLIQLRKQASTQTDDVTGDVKHACIINTVIFIVDLLKKWNNKPIFTRLNYHKKKMEERSSDDDSQGLWEGMGGLYERIGVDMGAEVVGCVVGTFKTLSKEYRDDKWLALPSHKDYISMCLSTSACAMLNQLKMQLQHMQQLLNKSLFDLLWQDVASALDKFIFEEVILFNHFNHGGAMQFQHDMKRNLFSIFHYTNKPQNYFIKVKEACEMLTLGVGSALIIKDILKSALHPLDDSRDVTDPIAVLNELGVQNLSPEIVYQLISLRIDLQSP